MSETKHALRIATARDAEALELLISNAHPDADLYSLVPCGRGRRDSANRARSTLFPVPATTATELATKLQHWLQDEISLVADARASSTPVPYAKWGVIPTISVTELDVVNAALGAPFEDPEAAKAYEKWCVKGFGVRIARPGVLYAWSDAPADFWAVECLQEHLRVEYAVDVSLADIQRAATNEPCGDQHAQHFFDAKAASDQYLAAASNATPDEVARREQEGPYYRWKPLGDATPPWDECASGSEFACRLAYAFGAKQLAPALAYPAEQRELLYVLNPPTLPDKSMVRRLAAGEWHAQLDATWRCRIERVPKYAWTVKPAPPETALKISAEDAKFLPDTTQLFNPSEMAKDMTQHLHVDVTVSDVRNLCDGNPASHDAQAAWNSLVNALAAANGVVGIVRF